MQDLEGFRAAVRARLRAAGRTQQQLARAIGLHPDVLSHKLNGSDSAVLTAPDVTGIVAVLAGWAALASRAEAIGLLELMAVPPQAIPADAWASPPLAALRPAGDGTARSALSPGLGAPRRALRPPPLPAAATALIGRQHELAEVTAALAAARLVTLTGVGGTGKTRLALQAATELAGRFADGAIFVDLSRVGDPALLATAIASALGLAPPAAAAAEGHLADALRDRELLLVLDNLEQLLDATPLLARLLTAAPALRILATSRIALRLSGEHTLRVPPLRLPGEPGENGDHAHHGDHGGPTAASASDSEAVRLFLARAAAVRPGVGGQPGELDAVAAICVALDGLPLAIELAAARVRLYTPQALLPLLRSRLALLTGGPRDLPRRQQTLHAALDWSYQLLPAAGRQLFGCLGVFAGPFDAAAAAAVSGGKDPAAILEQLAALAEQSMVEITHGTVPLFHLLQTVTEYALARLAEDGCLDEARRRHLEYYLALAESARDQYSGARQSAVLDLLEAAQPNIRAALEFACGQAGQDGQDGGCLDQGLRLATAAGILWRRRGPLAEGELEFGRLLARSDRRGSRADPRVHAAAVLEACILACLSGEYSRTHELSRQGIRLCGELGDQHGLIWAHHLAGEAALAAGDFGSAQEHLEEALALARQAGDLGDLAAASNMVGQLYRMTGRGDEAGRLLRQAVRLFRDAGDPDGAAAALHSLAETERVAGHTSLARRLHARSLRQHDAVGDKRGAAYCLEGMAALAAHAGDTRQALVYLAAAQVLREQIGAPLPPVDEASLAAILAPGLAAMTTRQQRDALAEGRNQPLADTIGSALRG